jgi:hypothetical protein
LGAARILLTFLTQTSVPQIEKNKYILVVVVVVFAVTGVIQ